MLSQQSRPLPFATAGLLRSRIQAVGKSLLYLLLALMGAVLVSALLKATTGQNPIELLRGDLASGLLAHAGWLLAFVIIPTAISLWLWKEPIDAAGWSPARSGRLTALGLGTGAGLVALIVLILWVLGAYSAVLRPVSPGRAIGIILQALALWLVQAAKEEGLYRGFAFIQLSRALSFWPTALLLGVWFGWGHVTQPGATGFSLVMTTLFGIVFAYSLLRTGSLWLAWGFHAAWNFAQDFVFGLPNSGGAPSKSSLMISTVHGPPLLTGGAAGPEGSLLCLGAVAGLFAVLLFCVPDCQRQKRPS